MSSLQGHIFAQFNEVRCSLEARTVSSGRVNRFATVFAKGKFVEDADMNPRPWSIQAHGDAYMEVFLIDEPKERRAGTVGNLGSDGKSIELDVEFPTSMIGWMQNLVGTCGPDQPLTLHAWRKEIEPDEGAISTDDSVHKFHGSALQSASLSVQPRLIRELESE
ncbi:hypothetical protein ACMU_03765 [Actibacterium mucosum KCTC 23349]|uniref:Uncharacterized protein n=1 Tax=Actibacterium mucosum KCTC 23349 TaxID=1454373 RepID=A0A037ZF24_9RHOB|nr:hypothetical protein [Actibacterium mucosum]KAJ54213.1 hypothetical protein ACMU_03765 [Actibacterium mucosum KCTC 23349]